MLKLLGKSLLITVVAALVVVGITLGMGKPYNGAEILKYAAFMFLFTVIFSLIKRKMNHPK